MIVIINSFDFSGVLTTARQLADRYDNCGVVSVHDLSFDLPSDVINEARFANLFEEICRIVAAGKKQGRADYVVSFTFDHPGTLKYLRKLLSRYDAEIYAFRLHFDLAEVARVAATLPREASPERYAQWVQHQAAGARTGDLGYAMHGSLVDPAQGAAAIWHDIHAPVALVPYQAPWPAEFTAEKARLAEKLGTLALRIEHIGSTAIPDLPAKPILDILISVAQLPDAFACLPPLQELGYAFIDYPQNTDHLFCRKGAPRTHHLQIAAQGSSAERDLLDFRDALRANEELRRAYLQLKQTAQQTYADRRVLYGEQKSRFIRKTLLNLRSSDQIIKKPPVS